MSKINDKLFVLILGMHRSGTSCLAGSLRNCGLYLGDVSLFNKANFKGSMEDKVVRKINDELLYLNGGSWRNPIIVSKINDGLKERTRSFIEKIKGGGQCCGVKDPRMLFCLNAWSSLDTKFVGTIRYPYSVAQSLVRRNQKVLFDQGLKLWFDYNSRMLALYRKKPFPIVNFDWGPEKYKRAIKGLAGYLGLNSAVEDFYEDSLKHNRSFDRIECEEQRALYNNLCEIADIEKKKLARHIEVDRK